MRPRQLLLIGICFFLVLSASGQAQELREWTDSTGKNKMQATFVSLDEGTVTLEDKNGKKFKILLEKLSKADQAFAKQQGENPFQATEDSPFMPEKGQPRSAPASQGLVMIQVRRNKSEQIDIDPRAEWTYQPAGGPEQQFKFKVIALPKRVDIFDNIAGLALNLSARKVAYGMLWKQGPKKPTTRISIGNLATGRSITSDPIDGEYLPLALSDDADRLVVLHVEGFGFGKKGTLEVWNVSDNDFVPEKSFKPYDDSSESKNDVAWAQFAGNGELITCSAGGVIVGWNIETCQPKFHLQAENNSIPALSPDRTVLGVYVKQQIALLDIARRELVGVISTPRNLPFAAMAFSPSGERIACAGQNQVLVWNGRTGDLERDVTIRSVSASGHLGFPDEDYVLLGKNVLVNIENEISLWQYNGTNQSCVERGLTLLAGGSGGQSGGIYPVKLPHPAAEQLLDDLMNKPELIAYRAGDPVALDVSGIPAAQQESVRKALTQKLTALRSEVSSSAPIKLVATLEGPKARTVSYHLAGSFQVQQFISKLEFQYASERAWGASGTNIPGILTLKRGEGIAEKLKELEQHPNFSFYESVTLPKLIVRPGKGITSDRPALGSSFIDRK